jgi:hypothetical protein
MEKKIVGHGWVGRVSKYGYKGIVLEILVVMELFFILIIPVLTQFYVWEKCIALHTHVHK